MCKELSVSLPLGGGHIYCDSIEAFDVALAPHAAEIMADIANYTELTAEFQISLSRSARIRLLVAGL